jgi:transposase
MSTGGLYHEYGIRGYRYVSTVRAAGVTTFVLSQDREQLRCPRCGSRDVERRGEVERIFHLPPIGRRRMQLLLPIARVHCSKCGIIRQVKVGFADESRRYSRSFERYVVELSRKMTLLDVARHLEIDWDTVKDIVKRHLQRHYAKPKLKHLRQIAIDEISVGRGNRYLTVVLDLKSGAVVFIGTGRGAEALDPFWKKLRASRARIQAVAVDMSPAYTSAIRRNLPQAVLVYDHFHIIKLYNDKLSELRRELYREATDKLHKNVLKGTRWLLLRNPENLDPKKKEPAKLSAALKLNESLFTAYYLKEDLRQLWTFVDKATARRHLTAWAREAEESGIRMLQKFAKTLLAHREGILAWYDHPISTGPLEGTNNKIKTMKRQAYGFRDTEFFMLKIYAIHEATYELVG